MKSKFITPSGEFFTPKMPCECCGGDWTLVGKKICAICLVEQIKMRGGEYGV